MKSSFFLPVLVLLLSTFNPAFAAKCGRTGTALQVLGSGGPEIQTKRASSSYLIWQNGKALALIDTGGGSALRFGESGADFTDLDVVLFTHLHVDHSVAFPAFVKSSFFQHRDRQLPVFGPTGNQRFPSTTAFVKTLFDKQHGAYRYLSDFTDQDSESSYKIMAHNVDLKPNEAKRIFANNRLRVTAMRTMHGGVPSLAYRIDSGSKSIVLSGDTNGENGNLEQLAKDADLFVAHNAIPEGATGIERELHMPPSVIGKIARDANVKNLVLSHRMQRTLGRETESITYISAVYHGKVSFADDLSCFELR